MAAKPTIRVENVGKLFRQPPGGGEAVPIPGIDGQVVYEIAYPNGRFSYMAQPFARGAAHTQVEGRSVWAWDGNWEAPTLSPSFLCIEGDPTLEGLNAQPVRVHLFLNAGKIQLCSDSTVEAA